MNESSEICQNCTLGEINACNIALQPEIFTSIAGRILTREFTSSDIYLDCRHFSCRLGRANARVRLRVHKEGLQKYEVTTLDGKTQEVEAITFGSEDKPINDKGRIVGSDGRIFSYQNDRYYETGQNALAR